MRIFCRLIGGVLLLALQAAALGVQPPGFIQPQTVLDIWQGPAPGSQGWTRAESAVDLDRGGVLVTNVRKPELLVYTAAPERRKGAAAVILPGGALRALVLDEELTSLVSWLTRHGVAVFILKYRTLQVDPAAANHTSAPPPTHLVIRNGNANPIPDDVQANEVLRFAIADTQNALRIVRGNASRWQLDPQRVGLIGVSAGGGVAIGTVLQDEPGASANFLVSIYGPSLMDVRVPENAPPLFIVTEANHGPVTEGLLALFSLWREAGRAVELHVFDVPAFKMTLDMWSQRFDVWMQQRVLVPAR